MAGLHIVDAIQTDAISEKTSANGITVDGVQCKDGWVKLATTGGTASELDFYMEYSGSLTFTPNGSGSTPTTVTVQIIRVGNLVTMRIPRIFTTTANASTIIVSGTLPTWATPANSTNFLVLVSNAGSWETSAGLLILGSTFNMYRDGDGTAFSNGASTGFEGLSISYVVS